MSVSITTTVSLLLKPHHYKVQFSDYGIKIQVNDKYLRRLREVRLDKNSKAFQVTLHFWETLEKLHTSWRYVTSWKTIWFKANSKHKHASCPTACPHKASWNSCFIFSHLYMCFTQWEDKTLLPTPVHPTISLLRDNMTSCGLPQ